jgi:hypothetical protein
MNENLIVFAFAALLGVITVLSLLLARALPMLHDSVARQNLTPLYDALLQVVAPHAKTSLEIVGDALTDRAESTMTPFDDIIAEKLNEKFAEWEVALEKASAEPPPDKMTEISTDKAA